MYNGCKLWNSLPVYIRDATNTSVFKKKGYNSIQFKNFIFKDGDPVSSQLIFPGAIQTRKQIQQLFIHIYKTTQVHQTITGKHNLHFHTTISIL